MIGLVECGVKEDAVLADLQPQARRRPRFRPSGRRPPGSHAVLQLQVPGEAHLNLREQLHLLAALQWGTKDVSEFRPDHHDGSMISAF